MSRGKAIFIVILCAIPVVFVLILLAIFSFLYMLVALLALIIILAMLYAKKPALFDVFRKKVTVPDIIDRPSEPISHRSEKKTYLILISASGLPEKNITMNNSYFTIGRSEQCSYFFPEEDSVVSRHHLVLEYNPDDEHCYVRDNDSANGTFVNSVRLKQDEPKKLQQGDSLMIAEFLFTVEYAHY